MFFQLAFVYIAVAFVLLAAVSMVITHETSGASDDPPFMAFGILACTLWPLTLVLLPFLGITLLIYSKWNRRAKMIAAVIRKSGNTPDIATIQRIKTKELELLLQYDSYDDMLSDPARLAVRSELADRQIFK